MKKYMMIFVLTPFFIFAGGDPILSSSLPKDKSKYSQQEDDSRNFKEKKEAAEKAKKQNAPEKQSKNCFLALFKCCCGIKVENN